MIAHTYMCIRYSTHIMYTHKRAGAHTRVVECRLCRYIILYRCKPVAQLRYARGLQKKKIVRYQLFIGRSRATLHTRKTNEINWFWSGRGEIRRQLFRRGIIYIIYIYIKNSSSVRGRRRCPEGLWRLVSILFFFFPVAATDDGPCHNNITICERVVHAVLR